MAITGDSSSKQASPPSQSKAKLGTRVEIAYSIPYGA